MIALSNLLSLVMSNQMIAQHSQMLCTDAAAGDASPLKERRGRVHNIAARFGATVAPAKMAASLRKTYSAGHASMRSEVD